MSGRRTSPGGSPLTDRRGFSLVEVTIALGIAVVAVIGIFALLQSGLGAYREAMNSSVSASIAQQVVSDHLLAEFDAMVQAGSSTGYYDERGIRLGASNAAQAVYVSESEILSSPVTNMSSNNLVTLRVAISSPVQPRFEKIFISYLARRGKDTP